MEQKLVMEKKETEKEIKKAADEILKKIMSKQTQTKT